MSEEKTTAVRPSAEKPSRVFAVQNMNRRDLNTGDVVPRFDLSEVEKRWGKTITLVSPTAKPFHAAVIIQELKSKLHDFSDDDFLLPIGNVTIIALAASIAAGYNGGRVKYLQWNATNQSYVQILTDLSA